MYPKGSFEPSLPLKGTFLTMGYHDFQLCLTAFNLGAEVIPILILLSSFVWLNA